MPGNPRKQSGLGPFPIANDNAKSCIRDYSVIIHREGKPILAPQSSMIGKNFYFDVTVTVKFQDKINQ